MRANGAGHSHPGLPDGPAEQHRSRFPHATSDFCSPRISSATLAALLVQSLVSWCWFSTNMSKKYAPFGSPAASSCSSWACSIATCARARDDGDFRDASLAAATRAHQRNDGIAPPVRDEESRFSNERVVLWHVVGVDQEVHVAAFTLLRGWLDDFVAHFARRHARVDLVDADDRLEQLHRHAQPVPRREVVLGVLHDLVRTRRRDLNESCLRGLFLAEEARRRDFGRD